MPLSRSLDGLRILDLTRLVPGPYATLILADFGADVIKVEPPGLGDYVRALPPLVDGMGARFRALNRNKRSIVIDLQSDAGRDAFLRLVGGADVVIEGFRPGVIERLGVGFETLRAVQPRLVLASISGYGQTGPYRRRAGHDLNYLAVSGVLAEMDAQSEPPLPLPLQLADLVGGGMWAAIAILAAVRSPREEAVHLDVSMTEGMLSLLGPRLAETLVAGSDASAPGEGVLTGGLARYRSYRAADGRLLSVGAIEPKFAADLADALQVETAGDSLDVDAAREQELRASMTARFGSRSAAEWDEVFGQRDGCVEVAVRRDELGAHPQHRARDVLRRRDDGAIDAVDGAVRTPAAFGAPVRPAPQLGEHTAQVLAEAGFDEGEIATLLDMGAVVQWAGA